MSALLPIAAVVLGGALPTAAQARCQQPPKQLVGTNIPGGGYLNFLCDSADRCSTACCADARCRSFSFILEAGSNGTTPQHNCTRGSKCCFLKTADTRAPHPDSGVTSGYLVTQPSPPPTPNPPPAHPVFSKTKPNILFLMVDDLRPELNVYGATHIHSPNIDALANRSLLMEKAYVQQSLCGPSRASILTGRRPDSTRTVTHGQKCPGSRGTSCYWRDVGSGNFTTIPQVFKNNGWYAASFGKTFDPRTSNGCDIDLSWSQPPVKCNCDGTGTLRVPHVSHLSVSENEEEGLVDPPIMDAAIEFLQTYNQTIDNAPAPFFLAVGLHRPHLPFDVPERMLKFYPENMSALEPPPNSKAPLGYAPIGWTYSGEIRSYRFNETSLNWNTTTGPKWTGQPNESLTSEEIIQLRRYYFAAVSTTDEQMGRILGVLSTLKIEDNTIITFVGDHGWHLSENGLYGKCTNFEKGTHIPLLVGGSILGKPLVNGPLRSSSLAEAVDLLPTLVELGGLTPLRLCPANATPSDADEPPELCREGQSLVPLLHDPTVQVRSAAFSQYPVPGCGGVGCGGAANNLVHPPHMGYTMVTNEGIRITEWLAMAYDNSSGAFEPQWGQEELRTFSLPFLKMNASQVPMCPTTAVVEVYNHTVDPGETFNVASNATGAVAVEINALLDKLRSGWRNAIILPISRN